MSSLAAAVSQASRAVRLLKDIPELGLRSGEVGLICSEWMAPTTAYSTGTAPARITGMKLKSVAMRK